METIKSQDNKYSAAIEKVLPSLQSAFELNEEDAKWLLVNMLSKLDEKRKIIIGYGPNKEMYQVKLDAVLYFEAVGEKVFAYTKQNIYEVKQRLYQVEEQVLEYQFKRASKSILVNLNKISSIVPEEGGRGKIRLTNEEIVIASRSYYKDFINAIKNVA